MGALNTTGCTGSFNRDAQSGLFRGNSNVEDSTEKLTTLLVDGYGKMKNAYLSLPSQEEKQKFLGLFGVTEHEMMMGSWRVRMAIDLLEEDEATETLA